MQTKIRGAIRSSLKVLSAVWVGIVFAPCGTRGQTPVNYFYGKTVNGNWDTTTANWSTPNYSTTGLGAWVNGNNANVDSGTATGVTLTLTQDITAQTLLFDARNSTTNNYTETYDLAGTNTLNLTSGTITFNFLTSNKATQINAQIDANLSVPNGGDLTVNVTGTAANTGAFGNTLLQLDGGTSFNNLNVYGGYKAPASARAANTVYLDHNATLIGTVNFFGYDGSNQDGAGFAVGPLTNAASASARLVSANNFVINPANIHGLSYIANDFIARIGATQGNELDVNGVISGNGDLMFAAGFSGGAGLVVLNQQNTYLGATYFNGAGTSSTGPAVVQLGIDNAIPTASKLIWGFNANGNGGTIDLNGHNQTVSSLWTQFSANQSVITNNGVGLSTLTISGSDSPGPFGMPIQDGGGGGKIALVRSGTGTTILTSLSNSYSGGTSILGGTLSINADQNLGSAPFVPTPGNLLINGGTLAVTGPGFNLNSNRGIALGPAVGSGTGTISVATGGNLSYNGVIDNNGLLSIGGLTVTGGGTLTLSSANTYTGPTQINQGTLSLAIGSSLHAMSNVTVAPGGTLAGTGTANGSVTVSGTIAPGDSTQAGQLNVGSLTLSGGGTYSWKLNSATGSPGAAWDLVSVHGGAGTVTLNSTPANKFTINLLGPGLSNFNDTQPYTFQILSAGSFAGNAFDPTAFNVSTSSFPFSDPGSTFTVTSPSPGNLSIVYAPGPVPLIWRPGTGGSGNWSNSASATDWSGGPWSSSASGVFNDGSGPYTVTLTDPITSLGLRFNTTGYTIAGTGSNTLTAPLLAVSNAADVDTISAQLVGTNLTIRGAGTIVLTGANTYTGTTTVASGTLQGTTASLPTDIINNSTLVFAQTASGTFSHNLSGSGAIVVQNQNNAVLTLGGTNTSTGFVKVNSGIVAVDSDARLGASNSVELNGGTLRTSAGFTTTRTINIGDSSVFNASGTIDTQANTVVLSGGNSLSPQIVFNNSGGTFHKAGSGELQITASGFSFANGGLIQVDGGTLTMGNKSAGTAASNPAAFFGPAGSTNSLVLMNGTVFVGAASANANGAFNSLSSITVTGSATYQIYRTLTSDTGNSQSVSPTTNGTTATPLFLNGTLTVDGNGNLLGTSSGVGNNPNTGRLTLGALTLTGDSTIQTVANRTTDKGRLATTNFTETGLFVDNGHTLTFGGQGSATVVTGAGIDINAAAGNNAVTGNWVLGSSNPSSPNGVIVAMFSPGDNTSFTSGSILVNSFSQLSFGRAFTFGTTGQTITLNGLGATTSTFSAGNAGALTSTSGIDTTLLSNLVLASNSIVMVPGSSATPPVGSLTLKGTISDVSGPFTLQKQGTGNLKVFAVNTSNENVLVGNGTIQVGDGSIDASLPSGNLTLGEQPTTDSVSSTTGSTTVDFRNAAQTISNLASSFKATTGTITQTVKLNGGSFGGTVLTINEPGSTTFGVGTVSTLNSTITGVGSIVLAGAATSTLTFTSLDDYTGGTTISGGKLALAGGTTVGKIYGGDVAVNANGVLGVNTAANLVAGNPLPPTGANANATALINSGGTMSIDSDFDASVLVDPNSVGILALNTNNSTLAGTNGSSAFIGAFGAELLTVTTLAPGAGGTYRLGGRGGSLTVANGVLTGNTNSLIIGSTQPNGSGTVILAAANTFGGGTTVNNGTLRTTADGALSTGGLAVNSDPTATSTANIQSNETVSSLSSTVATGGSATLTVAAGKTLTDNQAGPTTFAGVVALKPGASPGGGGTLIKSGAGTLEIDAAPSLGTNSSLQVNTTGRLTFNVGSGTATVGAGATVSVSDSAVLELAGSVSALGTAGAARADITNTSNAPAGVAVTGTNQHVGGINGSGTTQVSSGSDLTANHIIQTALVIGGASGMTALVTIAPSDASGNPLIAGSDSSGSDSLGALPAGAGLLGASAGDASALTPALSGGGGPGSNGSAVPEPSTIGLCLAAVLAMAAARRRARGHRFVEQ